MSEAIKGKNSGAGFKNKYLEYRRVFNQESNRSFASKLDKSAVPAKTETTSPSVDTAASPDVQKISTELQAVAQTQNVPRSTASSDVIMGKLKIYEPQVKAAALRYNLPEELIYGVMYQESRGNPRAVSHCGAMGLMQLMPDTARGLGVTDPFNVEQNIMGGAQHLRRDYDRFGRVELAVAAYNAGPGAVQKHGGVPPYRETQDYVPKVLGYANEVKSSAIANRQSPSNALWA